MLALLPTVARSMMSLHNLYEQCVATTRMNEEWVVQSCTRTLHRSRNNVWNNKAHFSIAKVHFALISSNVIATLCFILRIDVHVFSNLQIFAGEVKGNS